MLCETARERLCILSDGERLDNWRQAAAARRHCLTCADCRAYRRQLHQLRQTTRHLPVSLPGGMRERVLSQLPGSTLTTTTSTTTRQQEMTMRKLLALTAGAILAVAVTGTITAQILQHGSASFTVSDSDGHVWNIHNSYRG